MKLTLNIQDNSLAKILPLIEYLKSLDFVKVDEESEELFFLTDEQKSIIDQRIQTKPEDYLTWEDVKKNLRFK